MITLPKRPCGWFLLILSRGDKLAAFSHKDYVLVNIKVSKLML